MSDNLSLHIISSDPKQTQNIGNEIGKLSQKGDVLLLIGNLGAGKTCLTQGIARGLDIKEHTSSPSFMIVKEYYGRLPLYHIDLYRLDKVGEIQDLGLDDYLYGDGVCAIEWAEKGLSVLPDEYLQIEISYLEGNRRHFNLKPRGKRYQNIVTQLKRLNQERTRN